MSVLAAYAPEETEYLGRLRDNLPLFSRDALRISSASGAIVPLLLNRSQIHIHNAVEDQLRRTGRVRKIIVKGRKRGASTYVQGRYYHKLWRTARSLRAFILTHEQPATDTLFGMAQRFYDLQPEATGKPALKRGNAKELLFERNDSGYQVSTAGTKETGRSATFHLFHGSEVGFWPNAEDHVTGALQAVGNAMGTEIILESTANGVGNLFYRYAQAAIRGQSEFEAIFVPWFWGEDLVEDCPDTFSPSPEWTAYAQAHKLEWPQLYWAWLKNRELANSISASLDMPCWKFQQEYPATFDEAFQSSGNSFIPATAVLRARKPSAPVIGTGPIILGIDPARSGDQVGIIDRCGRRAGERISVRMDPGGSGLYVADQLASIILKIKPDMVNIDVGAEATIYDILLERGFPVNAVNFGSNPISTGPTGDDIYFNRRAEMHDLMRQWFNGDVPVQIPDDDSLQSDLCAAQWGPGATRYNSSQELIIEEKAAIKMRMGGQSPDLGDALALTFAIPYSLPLQSAQTRPAPRRRERRTGY